MQQQRLKREAVLRLFQQLHQNDDETAFRRASGSMRCFCGLQYREHYLDIEHPGYDGEPCDNRLCDGDIVHL